MHIALVASGRSLEGAGRGDEIDSAAGVMRLFDCHWQVPADHGRRWTWGLIPGPWRNTDFARYVRDLTLRPLHGWVVYHFGTTHPKLPPGTIPLDVRRWNEALRQQSGNPDMRITRGFAMFAAALSLGATRISAYGFDAIAAGRLEGYAYHGKWHGPVNEEKAAARHDFAAERRLIDAMAAANRLEVLFK